MVVGVLVELSNKNIDKVFDYLVPECFMEDIKVGIRVEVPFGKQILAIFVKFLFFLYFYYFPKFKGLFNVL